MENNEFNKNIAANALAAYLKTKNSMYLDIFKNISNDGLSIDEFIDGLVLLDQINRNLDTEQVDISFLEDSPKIVKDLSSAYDKANIKDINSSDDLNIQVFADQFKKPSEKTTHIKRVDQSKQKFDEIKEKRKASLNSRTLIPNKDTKSNSRIVSQLADPLERYNVDEFKKAIQFLVDLDKSKKTKKEINKAERKHAQDKYLGKVIINSRNSVGICIGTNFKTPDDKVRLRIFVIESRMQSGWDLNHKLKVSSESIDSIFNQNAGPLKEVKGDDK